MKKIGVYIHIPFCKQKCIYCDFISYPNKIKLQEKYVQAIIKEIRDWKEKNREIKIDTIYIGGGTPSYIESENIVKILSELKEQTLTDAQITIEVNPGTVTMQKLEDYINAGINRLSIGLQSTKDELLKLIGRIHNFDEFLTTYEQARNVGFKNINIDLMIGLPTQTIQDIKESLGKVKELNPEHVSVYSLIVEEGTPIYSLIEQGKMKLPDEVLERNMYWYVKNFLELHGFKHYEISNFSKEGYESTHNLNCWNQKEYRGFGVAAHSYIDKVRFSNIESIEQYIKNIETNGFEKNVLIQERQITTEQQKEYMLLGLRKIEGVSIKEFKNKFIDNPVFVFKEELQKLIKDNLIAIDGDKIQLTNKGLDLANLVWEEFV